jgi:hypothetical protein
LILLDLENPADHPLRAWLVQVNRLSSTHLSRTHPAYFRRGTFESAAGSSNPKPPPPEPEAAPIKPRAGRAYKTLANHLRQKAVAFVKTCYAGNASRRAFHRSHQVNDSR